MVMLGIANSRMKDFYDLWVLARQFEFQGPVLCQAIRATFERRRTSVPVEVPVALPPEFTRDRGKQTQWRAFIGKGKLNIGGTGLDETVNVLRGFLLTHYQIIRHPSNLTWPRWVQSRPWQGMNNSRVSGRRNSRRLCAQNGVKLRKRRWFGDRKLRESLRPVWPQPHRHED